MSVVSRQNNSPPPSPYLYVIPTYPFSKLVLTVISSNNCHNHIITETSVEGNMFSLTKKSHIISDIYKGIIT